MLEFAGPTQRDIRRRVTIGRAEDNDVVVDDLLVSHHHAVAEIDPVAGGLVIDAKSVNGT